MNAIIAIAGADAAERTRRFAFLLTIVAALYGGYLYVPDIHSGYLTVSIDGHRGVYNSVWMGMTSAVLSITFLSLAGFFLVRGSLFRDRELATDGIVAATPVRKLTFVLGKWLSNAVVLGGVAAVMVIAAGVTQILRGEDRHIDILAYLVPFFLIVVPAVSIVAAIAVLFDSVRFLRGALGAVAYVFLWNAMLVVPLLIVKETGVTPFDPMGFTAAMHTLIAAVHHAAPHLNPNDFQVGGDVVPKSGVKLFLLPSAPWPFAIVATRMAWLVVSIGVAALGAVFFDRFKAGDVKSGSRFSWSPNLAALVPNVTGLRLYRAEFALIFNGLGVWWTLGAVAIIVLSLVLPLNAVVQFVLPVALVWPLERWASLGARERLWNMTDVLSSTPHPIMRSILAQWAAGTTLGAIVGSGYLLRMLVAGDTAAFLACLATLCAIAIAALACGLLAGSSRLFESLYLIVWYIGPINHLPEADFAAATIAAPVSLALCAGGLAAAAMAIAITSRMRAYAR